MFQVNVYEASNWIAVHPVHYRGSHVGELFSVKINVSVNDLWGVEYKFRWNNTLLELKTMSITLPWSPNFIAKNETQDLGDGRTQHWFGASALAPASPFTGNATICTYTFCAAYKPSYPEPDGYSLLDLSDTKMGRADAAPIPHSTYDGEYEIESANAIYVDDDNVAGPWNGNQTYPFQNITSGLKHVLGGFTIYVRNGTYNENVVVNKAVSLIGESKSATVVDGNRTGNVVRITANNVNISGFKIVDSGGPMPSSGIKVESNHNTIANNIIENNEIGIYVYGSDANAILNNQIAVNDFHGILTIMSLNNNMTGNNITLNSNHGIWLDVQSHNNTVSKNILFDNAFSGIILSGTSQNNTAIQNSIASNSQGLQITGNSSGNAFYHNDIIGNAVQALLASYCDNSWDDGYPSGGNYWSDYTGTDLYRGPGQSETGSDGIGDSPRIINVHNQDDYPLTKPYAGPHDIAIMSLNTSKTIVGEGYSLNMTWKMLNYGEQQETFNVTIKADFTTIHTETTMLTGRNSTTMDFTLNTTGVPKGNYTISVYAAPVPGETDTVDNTCINGWVAVAMVGDVNGDGRVDLKDVYAVALAYGSFLGHSKWNPNLDTNNDGKIDLKDYFAAALNYGKVDP